MYFITIVSLALILLVRVFALMLVTITPVMIDLFTVPTNNLISFIRVLFLLLFSFIGWEWIYIRIFFKLKVGGLRGILGSALLHGSRCERLHVRASFVSSTEWSAPHGGRQNTLYTSLIVLFCPSGYPWMQPGQSTASTSPHISALVGRSYTSEQTLCAQLPTESSCRIVSLMQEPSHQTWVLLIPPDSERRQCLALVRISRTLHSSHSFVHSLCRALPRSPTADATRKNSLHHQLSLHDTPASLSKSNLSTLKNTEICAVGVQTQEWTHFGPSCSSLLAVDTVISVPHLRKQQHAVDQGNWKQKCKRSKGEHIAEPKTF